MYLTVASFGSFYKKEVGPSVQQIMMVTSEVGPSVQQTVTATSEVGQSVQQTATSDIARGPQQKLGGCAVWD